MTLFHQFLCQVISPHFHCRSTWRTDKNQKHISQTLPRRVKWSEGLEFTHSQNEIQPTSDTSVQSDIHSMPGCFIYSACYYRHISVTLLFPCFPVADILYPFPVFLSSSSSLRLTLLKHKQNTAFLRLMDKAVITGLSDPARGVITKADSSIQGQWMYEGYN